ncbi:Uncharacterized protein P8A3.02c [Choanephora cucurbitarum]|uniref:Uncharacterized protein P8A3.02c n=1 Tax=Choanephora cucurbitarum TaxID=101091 RepID=A0A1C7NIN1_9FUNG|nr:Uncharacterized protein P8A3.02c [Choanephora cucurbitarum]
MTEYDWVDLFGSEEESEPESENVITFDFIPGLKLIREGLKHDEQMALVNALIENDYFSGPDSNQVMLFGNLPDYLSWISSWLIEHYPTLFPTHISQRQPLFDQSILNIDCLQSFVSIGEGILSHVDLLRFEDGILIISLLSSCVMKMRSTEHDKSVDVLLRPGDVLALFGEARYKWEHGIEETERDFFEGEWLERGTRISVTLRKLVNTSQEHMISGTRS